MFLRRPCYNLIKLKFREYEEIVSHYLKRVIRVLGSYSDKNGPLVPLVTYAQILKFFG